MDLVYDPLEHKVSLQKLRKLLFQLDKPYIERVLHSSVDEYEKSIEGRNVPIEHNKKIVSLYMKNVQIKQYRDWDFKAGELWAKDANIAPGSTFVGSPYVSVDAIDDVAPRLDVTSLNESISQSKPVETVVAEAADEPIDEEAVALFGEGLRPDLYRKLMQKFNWLKQSYTDMTTFHTEALVTYTRYKVLEEEAIVRGDADAARQWGTLATKAAENAKINPKQMTKSDLNSSAGSFSEMSQAIEQAVDIIPILPQFKYKPSDAVDFLMWEYVNYVRRLEGKPECEYADIYKFYDEKVADYVKQYGDPNGMFTEDPTTTNRPQIERFIQLPDDVNAELTPDDEPEEVVLGD